MVPSPTEDCHCIKKKKVYVVGAAIGIVILVLCVLPIVLWWYFTQPLIIAPQTTVNTHDSTSAPLFQNALAHIRQEARLAHDTQQQTLYLPTANEAAKKRETHLLPIVWSEEDYGYVAALQIGHSTLKCVLDTGSTCLSVASAECVSNSACVVPDNRGYIPTKASDVTGPERMLQYASLDMRVKPHRDEVMVGVLDGALYLGETDFLVASQMSGTAGHLVGLMKPHANSKCTGLLQHIFNMYFHLNRSWGLVMCAKTGEGVLYIGKRPKELRLSSWCHLPLSKTLSYMGAYIVDVQRIGVRAQPNAPIEYQANSSPIGMLIDTGTAETYFPRTIGSWMASKQVGMGFEPKEIGSLPRHATVVIDFGRCRFEFEPQRYMVAAGGNSRYARSTFHRNTSELEEALGGRQIIILGIMHMQDIAFEFDWDANEVKMAIPSNPCKLLPQLSSEYQQ